MLLFLSFAPWALLLSLAVAHAPPTSAVAATPPSAAVIRSVQIDHSTAQASLLVSCPNCLSSTVNTSLSKDLDFSFDFSIVPGSQPCSSNLSLNAVPLDLAAPWAFEPEFTRGTASLNASGHGLDVDWYSACLQDINATASSRIPAAQVLTITVTSIDGKSVESSSVTGFTLSFQDISPPRLLRIESPPVLPINIDSSWINPPPSLRFHPTQEKSPQEAIIKEHIKELQRLEAELTVLKGLIKDKKAFITEKLAQDLNSDIESCDGVFCVVKAVLQHVHKTAHTIYQKIRPNPYKDLIGKEGFVLHSDHSQHPAMIAPTEKTKTCIATLPGQPEKCFVKEEKPSGPVAVVDDEDDFTPLSDFSAEIPPSRLWIVLKFFFVITGLALIFGFLRRCCSTPRKRQDRAARREQCQRDWAYRKAGRKQAFWDWMSGRKRGKPGRRPGDMDEKRARVAETEAYLEDQLQVEISHLKIEDELRQFRETRNAVTDLIRAEEGRSTHIGAAPPYAAASNNPFLRSPYAYPPIPTPTYNAGITIPHPINIPSRNHPAITQGDHTFPSSASSSDMPFSPVSRTTSLPSYRSKPPSYRSEDTSDEYSIGGDSDHDAWTSSDESSIPDLSPRPSGETMRTVETTRTFL
ncbi:hypothetical protein BT63DRAFT_331362 [Microthyrium microscopicum]|uniref:Uncharacterized protein n=1 Tax=Microthyrium microscopicum TaxID=703497 RepID=A0A6A6U5I4_9PEZI|nr:hypothetical protein BT63DRAFT_331362 [Microthyrium microscopicum]